MDKNRWKFIRTERIFASIEQLELQELETQVSSLIKLIEEDMELYEASLKDLERNIIRGFPRTKKRQYATDTVRIVQLNIVPYVPSRSLLFKAVASNEGRTYDPEIFFEDVTFEDEDTPNNVTFTASDGEHYHIEPIKFTNNNARVRCNCLDFHYRFAYYNAQAGDLYGEAPPPYHRKTTTYPPVNPMNVPGLCKHLLKLSKALEENKYITAFSLTATTPTASYKLSTITAPQGEEPPTMHEPGEVPPTGAAAKPEEEPIDQQPSPHEQRSIENLRQQYQAVERDYEKANNIQDPTTRKNMLDTILPRLKQIYTNIKQWSRKFPAWIKTKLGR